MSEELKKREQRPTCPYCEQEIITAKLPYCKPCDVSLHYCARCQIAVAREATACPKCGGELEWK